LDDVLHRLRLEDVWMWRGTPVIRQGFSQRREYLKEFVGHHWVPDARLLGGIFTLIAQPMSLENFAAKKDWSMCHSVEFIPEMAGRRRMVWFLEAQMKAAEAHAGLKQDRVAVPVPVPRVAPVAVPMSVATPVETGSTRRVRAAPVAMLPDIYDLYGEDGQPLSRASVQQFSLSMKLREKCSEGDVWVNAEWNSDFGGYTILGIVDIL